MRVTPRLWCGCTRSGSGCGVPSPRVDVGSLAGARSLNERSSQRQAETGGGATSPLGHALRLPPEIGDEKDPGRFPGRDLFLYSRRHRPLSADHTLILPHKGGCVTKYFVHARSCAQMRVCARETYVRKTSRKTCAWVHVELRYALALTTRQGVELVDDASGDTALLRVRHQLFTRRQ
ncbi:MAG: hypothetical protein QOE16_1338 [Microbacteriaceae bacterium]|nr:hypothetical protein [Microbacteriaceae bacterium]